MKTLLSLTALFCFLNAGAQTVTDFDGNVYQTVTVGDQTWFKENLKSTHYADGKIIPGVCAYNNNDSLANVYGNLYSWDAATNGIVEEGTQGACPAGYHVPSQAEWELLECFLGGSSVAGGKLKATTLWESPNCGADNSSGFSALPSGEFDGYQTETFQWINNITSFWTSTDGGSQFAVSKFLSYDNCELTTNSWSKDMKYSVRCLKGSAQGITENQVLDNYRVFAGETPGTIVVIIPSDGQPDVNLKVYDLMGRQIATHVLPSSGIFIVQCPDSGLYLIDLTRKTEKKGQKLQTR